MHGSCHLVIDNDDAYLADRVSCLCAECKDRKQLVLIFHNDLQCDIEKGLAILANKPSNPFISRIERTPGRMMTVLATQHDEAAGSGVLTDISTKPMWLQVIHAANVLNRLDPGPARFRVDLLRDFGISRPFRIALGPSVEHMARYWFLHRPKAVIKKWLK